jgi:oxygen-independent coproporphyrinogen-3 oxidase
LSQSRALADTALHSQSRVESVSDEAGRLAAFRPPRSAYIHVPFCRQRCEYCDFTLVVGREGLVQRYLAALERQLASLRTPVEVETLFLGGGTPSHLQAGDLAQLLSLLRHWFRVAPAGELSVEANPLDLLDDARVRVLVDAGVNRISLGAQSFVDSELTLLGRDHREEDIARAVEQVRGGIPNLSLDLIFGVPGQTLGTWRRNLERALELQPRHLSTYGLTIEKGTRFYSLRNAGRLSAAPEELEAQMYELAMDLLPARGLLQYELSNFAEPGWDCRHNHTYWAGQTYHGFGPGAARYLQGTREVGHRSTTTWLKRIESGEDPIGFRETLSAEDRAREAVILGLRRVPGINRSEIQHDHGWDLDELGRETWSQLKTRGLVETTSTGYRLTRMGRLLADSVTVELVGSE